MPSKRQQYILHLISSFTEAQGYPPTYREIQRMLGLASVGTVQKHIHQLKAQGLLTVEKKWRALKPLQTPSLFPRIPIIGALSKTKKIELFVSISFCQVAVPIPGPTYYGFLVKDDSFLSEHIIKNDLVIIEARTTPRNGEYILITTPHNTPFIGYYCIKKNRILDSCNEFFFLHEKAIIHGSIITIMRNYCSSSGSGSKSSSA